MATETKELQIGIGVTANTAGAREASAALNDVGAAAETLAQKNSGAAVTAEELAKQFADSNAKAAEWGNTISKLNNEQLLQLEEKLREQIKLQETLGNNTDELRRKLTETYSVRTEQLEKGFAGAAGKARDAATAIEGATKQVKTMQSAAQGARNVVEGLSAGGFGGLVRAGTGAATVIRSLATGALGAAFIPVLAAAAGGLFLLRRRTEEAEKAAKSMFDEHAKDSERLKASYEAIDAASKKSLDAQLERIEKLASGYETLLARIDAADARVRESQKLQSDVSLAEIDRDEQRALAKAKTDEERSAIGLQFGTKRDAFKANAADTDLQNLATKGRFQIDQADQESRRLQRESDAAVQDVRTKRGDANAAKATAKRTSEEKGVASEEAIAARENAKVLEHGAAESEKALAELVAAIEAATARIAAQRSEGEANVQRAKLQSQLRGVETETAALQKGTEANPKIKQLREDSQRAMANGDFAGQDRINKELRAVEANSRSAAEIARRAKADPEVRGVRQGETASGVTISTPDDGRSRGPRVEIDGVAKSLDAALKESRAKDSAFISFAENVASDSSATRKAIDRQSRQIENAR